MSERIRQVSNRTLESSFVTAMPVLQPGAVSGVPTRCALSCCFGIRAATNVDLPERWPQHVLQRLGGRLMLLQLLRLQNLPQLLQVEHGHGSHCSSARYLKATWLRYHAKHCAGCLATQRKPKTGLMLAILHI